MQILSQNRNFHSEKEHHNLKHTAALTIMMEPYVREYIVIDIMNKPQPAIIRISGNRGDITLYASNATKYPDESQNQQCFKNE